MRGLRILLIGFLLGVVAVIVVWRTTRTGVDPTATTLALGRRSTDGTARTVSPVEPDESRESHIYPVERVVDGDTIVVRYEGAETTVRLIGVDTPETVHPNKPVERFGKEASAFTKKTLANASVRLEFDNERFDRYGRLLAYVYRASDELFVNEELIRQGYGHAYTRFPFRHLDRFRQLEAEAREAGRGLWSEGSREPATSPTGDVVYVTATGRKYHRVDCRLLRGNAKAIPLSEARASYEPCAVCTPPR